MINVNLFDRLDSVLNFSLKKMFHLVLLLSVFSCFDVNAKDKLKIAWLAPMASAENNQVSYNNKSEFWQLFNVFMQAAAQDLNVEIIPLYYNRNRILMLKLVNDIIEKRVGNIDGVLLYNYQKQGVEAISRLNKARIPVFSFVTSFSDQPEVALPRQKYPYWIGQMYPDDIQAGKSLAIALIETYKNRTGKYPKSIVAIGGEHGHNADVDRRKGLQQALALYPQVTLMQQVPAYWSREEAKQKYKKLRLRYPNTQVFWCANDAMALGVKEGAKEEFGDSANNIVMGGIDWLQEMLKAIEDKTVDVSLGGNFLEGALSLILLHDYLHGHDFIDIQPLVYKYNLLEFSNANNTLSSISTKLNASNIKNKIDFSLYSTVYNPDITSYRFDLQAILKKL